MVLMMMIMMVMMMMDFHVESEERVSCDSEFFHGSGDKSLNEKRVHNTDYNIGQSAPSI